MEPIVSPWIIYLINTVEGVCIVSGILSVVIGIAFCILLRAAVISAINISGSKARERTPNADDVVVNKLTKKWAIRTLIITLFLLTVSVFIPSRDTLIGMCVAQQITPNNIESVKDAGKDATKFLLDEIFKRVEKDCSEEK